MIAVKLTCFLPYSPGYTYTEKYILLALGTPALKTNHAVSPLTPGSFRHSYTNCDETHSTERRACSYTRQPTLLPYTGYTTVQPRRANPSCDRHTSVSLISSSRSAAHLSFLFLLFLLKYLILPDWALHQGIRWCGLFMIKCCVHICTVLVKNLAWCNYIWGSWTSASLCLKQFTEGDVTMLSESWFHSGMVRWMNAYL